MGAAFDAILKRIPPDLVFLLQRVRKSEILTRAAALAYSSMLGMVPILGLVFWYLSSIQLTQRWLADTKRYILFHLNFSSSAQFVEIFDRLTNLQSVGWGYVGIGLLLYTAWSVVTQFGNAVDCVMESHSAPPPRKLEFSKVVVRRVLVMLWLPISLACSISAADWVRKDSWLRYLVHAKTFGPVLAGIVMSTVDIATCFFIYKYIPRRRVPWWQALKVAIIIGPISELSRYFFRLYAHHAAHTQQVYGVFAILPLFILWVQIGWLILLSGALFIRFPERERQAHRVPG